LYADYPKTGVNIAGRFTVVKGAPQAVLERLAIAHAHEAGGHIIGKRCGTSQNIGAKARQGKTDTSRARV
jgi:hypothetical protein